MGLPNKNLPPEAVARSFRRFLSERIVRTEIFPCNRPICLDKAGGSCYNDGHTFRACDSHTKGPYLRMKKYTFRYGDGSVSLSLDERQVLGELHGNHVPPIGDIPASLAAALDAPIGLPPLDEWIRPGERVVLVVSDMSRFWMRQDKVIPHLVRYLNERCGVADADLTILVANGTHEGGGEGDLRTLVTDGIYDRIRVVNHDCTASDLVYLGTTPHDTPVYINAEAARADRLICLGACTHHVMAGFGGGRKSILPGISGLQTICHNHAYALDPSCLRSNPRIGNGRLAGNPLNEDMCEAAGLVKNLFMVNLVMNAEMQLAEIYAGHYLFSWEAACAAVDRIYRVDIPERADVLIASCGGYPKDMSLYQGTKTIDNVESGLKEGGTLILLIEAREGGGPAEYFDWIGPLQDGTMEERLRTRFTVPGYIFLLNCEQARRYNVMMLTSVAPEVVAPMGLKAYSDPERLLADAHLEGKTVYVVPNGSTVIPHVKGE